MALGLPLRLVTVLMFLLRPGELQFRKDQIIY